MKESIIRTSSRQFALDIVMLCRKLKENKAEATLINQLLRCGTSIGANIAEAQYAQSTRDFISKLEIALKECAESAYWLELLRDSGCLTAEDAAPYIRASNNLRRMLVRAVTTLKEKVTDSYEHL